MNKQSKKGANRIEKVFKRYADTFGVSDESEYYEAALIVDAIADLRHYCDANGLDYYALSVRAYRCYLVEKQDGQ